MPHRRRMLKQIRSSARSCVVMGGVCCGLRERLEEERQERQEGQERPARPEILPTEEEAFEQLLAERKKPETMEEAMAQAVELTKLLQAMNGTTEEAQEGYEVGDLVVLSERVSQWRFNYAVVTEARTLPVFCCCSSHLRQVLSAQVSEARLTVMVLRDDRRTVVDVAWPSPCNVTLESRAGRLHQKVGISQLSSGKWRSCTRAVLQIGGSLSRMGSACVRCTERCQCFLQRGMQGGVDRLHWMPDTRNFRSSFRGCRVPRYGFSLPPDHTSDSASMSRGADVELVVNVEFSASEPGAETCSCRSFPWKRVLPLRVRA